MKETEGIIFDYGGTLDSRGDHWSEVIWRSYVSERAEVTREAFRASYVHAERALERDKSIGPQDTFRDVMRKKIGLQLNHLGIYTPELLEAISRRCYDSARECVAESAVTLHRLAEDYPLAIVSNFYGNLHAVLADFGVSHLFRAVIDSGETGIRKPDPEIFRAGLRALGITDP
ncbi:MAG: HAD family hydrolase, partial [Duncaniella sp.]